MTSAASASFRPPAPPRRSEAMTFARVLISRQRDLLSLMPASAYQVFMSKAPGTKRPMWIVNHPQTVREILVTKAEIYAKADMMTASMKPLLGDGMMVSDGETWERQHALIAPAFERARLHGTFVRLAAAANEAADALAAMGPGTVIDLGEFASRLSAEMIFRVVFSGPPATPDDTALVEALIRLAECTFRIDPADLFSGSGNKPLSLSAETRRTAIAIRNAIGTLVDRRIRDGNPVAAAEDGDLAGALLAARDPATGAGFDRDGLVDQIATVLLAGHEATASALTWALYLVGCQPDAADRIARETQEIFGNRPVGPGAIARSAFTRQVFRETLRLYPPTAFIPRTARAADQVRNYAIAPGDLLIISPWLIHRHDQFWSDPDVFDPDRFAPDSPTKQAAGAFMPFGLGARACIGQLIAQAEGVLALAAICRSLRLEILDAEAVMPVCRMTVRPEKPIRARLHAV